MNISEEVEWKEVDVVPAVAPACGQNRWHPINPWLTLGGLTARAEDVASEFQIETRDQEAK